jgi:hypothetical protein
MKIQDVPHMALEFGKAVVGCGMVLVGGAAAVVLVPIVSLVALPILGIKAAILKSECTLLYNKTITDLTRQPFGRIAGQDYTRWDGKTVNLLTQEQNAKQVYCHGCAEDISTLTTEASDNPFKTEEDAQWLRLEYARREKLDTLMKEIDWIKIVAKCIIPVVGLVWVLPDFIWDPIDHSDFKFKDKWGWKSAINFHQESLARRLA